MADVHLFMCFEDGGRRPSWNHPSPILDLPQRHSWGYIFPASGVMIQSDLVEILRFLGLTDFAWQMPIHAPFLKVFGDFNPLKWSDVVETPKRH